MRNGPHDRARREHAPCKLLRWDHRGRERRVGRTTGATRQTPPPLQRDKCCASCLRRACVVPATCVLRREDDKPPPPPHTSAPPRMGDEGMGGRKAPPPPEDKAAGWGGSGERVRDGPRDRARGERALCMPQRGDHRGCERRVGRATTGAARQGPPPLQRDKCRASCLRRACVVPATCVLRREDDKGAPPPPPPHTSAPPRVGDDSRGGRKAAPPPRTTRQGGEAAERGCGTGRMTEPEGSTCRASSLRGTTGGENAG